jgi:hypothetical protein
MAHGGVGLGTKVLDDDLLHGAVGAGGTAQREDRLRPLGQGLPDPDQQPGGERHRQPAGVVEDPEPDLGVLVR